MYSKLIGLTIEEVIDKIIFEQITEVNYFDGEFLETALENYKQRIESDFEDIIEGRTQSLKQDLVNVEERVEYLEELLQENGIKYE